MNSLLVKAVQKEFKKVKSSDSLKYLSKAFTRHQYVLVEDVSSQKYQVCENKHLLNHYIKHNKCG
jgi:hypothetical protein